MSIGERKNTVVETGRFPAIGGMAIAAILSILAAMSIIPGMASITGRRRALIDIIDVAIRTGNVYVFSRQLKTCEVVVKTGGQPAVGCMTIATIQSEAAVVLVVLRVAGETIGGRAFKDIIDMAARALNAHVFANQFEIRQVVIKKGRDPRFSIVAGGTECA
jgi:hypothetical protein